MLRPPRPRTPATLAAGLLAAVVAGSVPGQAQVPAAPDAARTTAPAAAGSAVPPERAAPSLRAIPIANPGFESTKTGPGGAPEGWTLAQHAGEKSYVATADDAVFHSGAHSLRLENTGPEPYGIVFQPLAADGLAGKAVRLSAWIRTQDARGNRWGGGAALSLHSTKGGYPAGTAAMRRDAAGGTTGWTRYEVVLVVAAGVDQIEPGLLLYGPGTAWFDDVSLDVVEPPR